MRKYIDKLLKYIDNYIGNKNLKIFNFLLPIFITCVLKLCFIILPLISLFLFKLADFDNLIYYFATISTLFIIIKYKFNLFGLALFRSLIFALLIWIFVFLSPFCFLVISALEMILIPILVPMFAICVYKFVDNTQYKFLKYNIINLKKVIIFVLLFLITDILYFVVFKFYLYTDVISKFFMYAGGFSGFYIIFLIMNLMDYFKMHKSNTY